MTLIENVSDTARWVAHYRALESERPDAVFHDRFARRLAGPEGEAIVRSLADGEMIGRPIVARTAVFDEWVLDRVTQHGADAVLNLAAGLDARPWRLPLPATLHWIDADLPGILNYKTAALRDERPNCQYEAVTIDLTDPAAAASLFARVGGAHQRVLVITEGLLIYLPAAQVAALGRALHQQPTFQWWMTDLATPRVLQYIAKSHGAALQNAPFRFAPEEGTAFFGPLGWEEVVFRSTMEEARRLNRPMRRDRFVRLISRLSGPERREKIRRVAGYVLLKRSP